MDIKLFWLLGLVVIGITGTALTFARRYQNNDRNAGIGVVFLTFILLLFWVIAAYVSLVAK